MILFRKKIGLSLLFNNSTNSGIVNYLYNIISALNSLPSRDKPFIYFYYSVDAEVDAIKSISYPFIKYILLKDYPDNFIFRKINSLIFKLVGINYFQLCTYQKRGLKVYYPYFPFNVRYQTEPIKCKLEWLVDFNNRVFPNHYNDMGETAKESQDSLIASKRPFVLSSCTLLTELKSYYPDFQNKVFVLRFASTLPKIEDAFVESVINEFCVNFKYFISPNQFWEHKNQMVVLEAVRIIKMYRPDLDIKVLFTGSLEVTRGKGKYIESLKEYIEAHDLHNNINFLGVIPRMKQLALMKGALAILQPSLYEGWSTLVEESKALNKPIVLSDIPVHHEQISENGIFFDPTNPDDLAQRIIDILTNGVDVVSIDYSEQIKRFAFDILSAFNLKNVNKL